MLNIKYYWFLILLILLTFYRLDLSCFSKECPLEEATDKSFINLPIFIYIREHCTNYIDKYFPSPYSELLLGMTVGLDRLSNVPNFKTALKQTGTIHVVVVSGFNISLVFNCIVSLLGSKYKLKNLFIAQFVTIIYALISGFEPPVLRALVMGSIISWGKYYGRGVDTLLVLVTSGLLMIVIQPLYFFSLSFILSFMATLGLILFSSLIVSLFKKVPFVLIDDFVAGLSAQLLVWPIISYFFGTVSLISLVVNTLILWTVPFTTIFGTIYLMASFVSDFVASLFLIPLYVLMNVFVEGVYFFNSLHVGYFLFKLTGYQLLAYYIFMTLFLIIINIRIFATKSNTVLNHDN